MTHLTIREIADAWKKEKRPYVKQSTFAAYMLTLENHLLPYFGDMTELSEPTVQTFVLDKLNGGLSIKTIKDILIVLKMIMKHGVKNKWMEHAEWDIKYPTTANPTDIEVLTVANHKKILDHIKANFSFKALGIYLCLTTGLRIGEICALRWEDINTQTGTLQVKRTIERIYIIEGDKKHTEVVINDPKTPNSIREIPLSAEALSLIKPLMKIVNTGFYVISNDAKPISQLLQKVDEIARHSGDQVPRPPSLFRYPLHREQLRLQDCQCSSRSLRHIHHAQPLRSPQYGTEETMYLQNV